MTMDNQVGVGDPVIRWIMIHIVIVGVLHGGSSTYMRGGGDGGRAGKGREQYGGRCRPG
jgi:hypothetical protein